MERLLGLTSIMGIGRSRGIDLGIVKILNQEQKVLT
jgi:CRISPR/Cas system endoribonuclease Cas6 (RAMP superfamily)